MPQKHVIVEGMDGSGKDTLITAILQMKATFHSLEPHFRLHERAATSLGGPVANLDEWVEKDIVAMPNNRPFVYNRHPLISEMIYGPVIRGVLPEKFTNKRWLANHRIAAALECIVVFCDPGVAAVRANLARNPHAHMPGVMENSIRLYDRYHEFMSDWPGRAIRYNYTTTQPYKLMRTLRPIIQNGLTFNGN